MYKPLQVTFRNLPHSDAIEASIRHQMSKLEALCDRIHSCRVVVDAPHNRLNKGKHYQVVIELHVPNEVILINRDPAANKSHEDCYLAIRNAFTAARRQLKAYMDRQKNRTKTHELPPLGRIIELYPDDGYGFIAAPEGGDVIYFHANSVASQSMKALTIGDQVRFAVASIPGDKGPQASTVQLVSKQRLAG